jgi:uncharacterized protein YyaL (SSP411 family)
MQRCAELTADAEKARIASDVVARTAEAIASYPSAFGHALGVADGEVFGAIEVAIAGQPADARFVALARAVHSRYLPSLVLAGGQEEGAQDPVALLRDRRTEAGAPAAYVCRRYLCESPTGDPGTLGEQLDRAPRAHTTLAARAIG